jgi:phosphatidylserine decarboxylase
MGEGGGVLKGTAWILSAAAVFRLWVFRGPDPSRPSDADLVVAPGQGKIVAIQDVEEHTFMAGPARKISIFLSVFDVHVQRAPVSGTVEFQAYDPGKYVAGWLEKASDDNEQASLGIATEKGRVLVRQVAGLIARRIITDASEGDSVERGKRFGLIRFGSRVDLFVPMHWEVLCAVGDKVRVGTTVIARQMEEPT